jgi:phosphohistidine swiveling domain-containing protein
MSHHRTKSPPLDAERRPDLLRLQLLEILMAHRLEPRWLPRLGRAAPLVMEMRGILSHVAILAREFGTPSIDGVRDATRQVKTGDHLRLMSDGAVVVLEDGPEFWMSMAHAGQDEEGTKARRLALLQQEGLSVPAAAVLTYESPREASAGGPEHVTDGRTPELRVRLSREDGSESIVGAAALLTTEQPHELARTGLHLERLFDTPVSTMQEPGRALSSKWPYPIRRRIRISRRPAQRN